MFSGTKPCFPTSCAHWRELDRHAAAQWPHHDAWLLLRGSGRHSCTTSTSKLAQLWCVCSQLVQFVLSSVQRGSPPSLAGQRLSWVGMSISVVSVGIEACSIMIMSCDPAFAFRACRCCWTRRLTEREGDGRWRQLTLSEEYFRFLKCFISMSLSSVYIVGDSSEGLQMRGTSTPPSLRRMGMKPG